MSLTLRTSFITYATVLCFATVLLSTASVTHAQSSSDYQAKIQMLMKMVAQLQAQLAQLKAGGGSGGASGASCVQLSRTLYAGQSDTETGGEVSKLQRFLGVNPTGFFGPTTEQKVREWQSRKGIVSSGDADSTGYGMVGGRTRGVMAEGCGVIGVTSDPVPSQPRKPEKIDVVLEPSCTIKTSNANPKIGESFTISWTTRNIAMPAFNEDLKGGGSYNVEKNGSRTFTEYSAYEGKFGISEQLDRHAPLCTVSVDIQNLSATSQSEATIDGDRFTNSSNSFSVSGTAAGTQSIFVALLYPHSNTSDDWNSIYTAGNYVAFTGDKVTKVVNGKWKVVFSGIPGRQYEAYVFANDNAEQKFLTKRLITVTNDNPIDFAVTNDKGIEITLGVNQKATDGGVTIEASDVFLTNGLSGVPRATLALQSKGAVAWSETVGVGSSIPADTGGWGDINSPSGSIRIYVKNISTAMNTVTLLIEPGPEKG